jgi:hypothetical protein
VQPAGRGLEVLVGRAEGVGGMDAAVKPTWRYSRRPLADPPRPNLTHRGRRVTPSCNCSITPGNCGIKVSVGGAFLDRQPQGYRGRAYRDVFTPCPGKQYPHSHVPGLSRNRCSFTRTIAIASLSFTGRLQEKASARSNACVIRWIMMLGNSPEMTLDYPPAGGLIRDSPATSELGFLVEMGRLRSLFGTLSPRIA